MANSRRDEIKWSEQEINRLEMKKRQLQAEQNGTYDILEKLSSGEYEVYYKDKLNDGYFDVLAMGTIIVNKNTTHNFKNFSNDVEPGSIKIGPIIIGEYEDVIESIDFFQMISGKELTMEKVLTRTTEGDLTLKINKNLKIRKKFKFDDKDDELGF
jgi:hypothetical protein